MAISRALGARIKRREDPRLITGTATYVDDIMLPGLLHVIFVRSPHAHAKVTAIDTEAAMRADAPVIHPDLGTNACFRVTFGSPVDEVFASAEKTVSLRLIQQRLVPTAMETRGVVAHYKGGELTLWTSTQIPHVVK